MGKTEKVPEFGLDFIGLALADPRNVRNIGKSRITEALTFVRFPHPIAQHFKITAKVLIHLQHRERGHLYYTFVF